MPSSSQIGRDRGHRSLFLFSMPSGDFMVLRQIREIKRCPLLGCFLLLCSIRAARTEGFTAAGKDFQDYRWYVVSPAELKGNVSCTLVHLNHIYALFLIQIPPGIKMYKFTQVSPAGSKMAKSLDFAAFLAEQAVWGFWHDHSQFGI